MARGIALSVVRDKLKRELRDAIETNSYQDDQYNGKLIAKQSDLCNAYKWDFLEDYWDAPVVAGTRYVAIPTSTIRGIAATINFEFPVHVDRFWNTFYYPVDSSITMDLFNYRNSDLDQRQDPIMRWQMATNVNETAHANEIEVWPIPLTNQVLRFSAQRSPLTISGDTDTFDLDDLVIVYGVAMEELALRDERLYQLMGQKFQARLMKLRAGYENAESFVLGQNQLEEFRRTRLVSVRIGVA